MRRPARSISKARTGPGRSTGGGGTAPSHWIAPSVVRNPRGPAPHSYRNRGAGLKTGDRGVVTLRRARPARTSQT